MARPQVSIRLATDGKAQVSRDFVEIGDSGSASARRIKDAFERDATAAERAIDKLAKTQQRLAAVSSTPVQQRIGQWVGIGPDQSGAARASAAALATEMDRAEREARQLIAAIDPLAAAQQRYAAQTQRAVALLKVGALDKQRYNQLIIAEKQALDAATQAQLRHGRSAGAMRAGFSQLSFQVGDVTQQMAMGVPASRIWIQQSGQVIQALQLMGGQGNAFLKFLGGPWGMAIATGTVALSPFIGKLFETKDGIAELVAKMKEEAAQAYLNVQAEDRFARSAEGVAKAIRDSTKARQESVASEKSAAERANIAAKANLNEEISIRRRTQALLAETLRQAQVAEQVAARVPGADGAATDASVRLSERAAEIRRQLKKQGTLIADARAELEASRVDLAVEVGKRRADPIARLNKQYDDEVRAAKKASTATLELTNAMAEQIKMIEKRRAAALKAAQATSSSANRESGREVTASEAAAIARAAGLQVNSSNRSFGQQKALYDKWIADGRPKDNPVAPPGSSAHEGARGRWALDIQFGKGVTPDLLRKVFAAQGVSLTKVLKERGHFHAEGSRSGAAGAESAAETAAAKAVVLQNAFEERRDRLNEELLRAEGEAVVGWRGQSEAAQKQAMADRQKLDRAIQNDVEEGKLTQAQADELKLVTERVAKQRLANIAFQDRLQAMQQTDATLAQEAQFRIDGLEFQDSIVRTAGEHRQVQLEILDLVYEEKKRHLEYLKAQAELNGATEEAARIQAQINELPNQKARQEATARLGTKGPLEQWGDQVPQNAAELNEAMDGLKVQGLNGLVDVLVSAKDGWEAMRNTAINALQQITAELIRMAAMKFLFNILGMAAGGGGGAGGVGGDFASSLLAGNTAIPVPGSAVGSHYFGGGLTWVGEHGKELVSLPRGSRITPAAESSRMAAGMRAAANTNRPAGDTYNIRVAVAGGGGTRQENRRTGMQIAGGVHEGLARRAKKALA